MKLTANQFASFNSALMTVMKSAGVSSTDLSTVGTVLQSFSSKIVFAKRKPAPTVTGIPPIPSQKAKAPPSPSKKAASKSKSAKK